MFVALSYCDTQGRIEELEQAQVRATRLVSSEIADYKQRLAAAEAERDELRRQLAEAEAALAALRQAQLQAGQQVQELEQQLAAAEAQRGQLLACLEEVEAEGRRAAEEAGRVHLEGKTRAEELAAEVEVSGVLHVSGYGVAYAWRQAGVTWRALHDQWAQVVCNGCGAVQGSVCVVHQLLFVCCF